MKYISKHLDNDKILLKLFDLEFGIKKSEAEILRNELNKALNNKIMGLSKINKEKFENGL